MTTSSLQVPGPELSAVAEICEWQQPYDLADGHEEVFCRAMRQVMHWHSERSPFYRKLLLDRGVDIESILSYADLYRVPAIPANFFKKHEVVSVDREEISTHLTSSGTTGQKSQMFFDAWSLGSAQRMVDWIFEHYGWVTPDAKSNYLLYSYEQKPGMKLGTAYTDNYLCKYSPAKEAFSALRFVDLTRHEFDAFGCISVLQKYAEEGLPVRIFGFPAFLYFTVKQMKELGIDRLELHPESLVFLGGGWKGHQNQAISKSGLYDLVEEQLGIPNHRLRDGFGSVEHCIPYVECSQHNFHVPVWSRVMMRDLTTLEPLPFGEAGFLNFISPYITSVPANSVLMGDLATLYEGRDCACEVETPYFVVHGRAGTSKNKSCAVAASELLKRLS